MKKILVKEANDFVVEFNHDPEDTHTKFIISYFQDGHFQDEVFITREDIQNLEKELEKEK